MFLLDAELAVGDKGQLAALKRHVQEQRAAHDIEFLVFSLHWGSNYQWQPCDQFRQLARFLIDECG